MAVQAAPLPPLHHQPFVPFAFPTADFGALAEKSYGYPDGGGGLLGLEGAVGPEGDGGGGRGVGDLCPEGSDSREATRELLSFIDSASSNIKLALDKPGKSKRKVNHRKYLQKQIKRCTGLIGGGGGGGGGANPENLGPAAAAPSANKPASTPTSSAAPPPCKPPPPPNRESKSLAALFDSWRSAGAASTAASSTALAAASPPPPPLPSAGPGSQEASSSPSVPVACKKLPLRDRNLPRSFFTEPAPNPPGLQGGPVPSGVTEELFDLLTAPDYRALLQESTEPPLPPPAVFSGSSVLQAAEPPLYEPLPSLAPLLYAESPLRPLPALYAAVAAAAAAAAASDHPATPPFFADCPTALPYDYGYSRGAPYSNL